MAASVIENLHSEAAVARDSSRGLSRSVSSRWKNLVSPPDSFFLSFFVGNVEEHSSKESENKKKKMTTNKDVPA
jgi:hypothetical protein